MLKITRRSVSQEVGVVRRSLPNYRRLFISFALVYLALISGVVTAQERGKFLVLFQDKNGSPYSLEHPEVYLSDRALERRTRQNIAVTASDLPVNPSYVAEVQRTGAEVIYRTKWFNGVVVSASEEELRLIQALPFYKGVEKGKALTAMSENRSSARRKETEEGSIHYGNSKLQLDMLGVPALHELGHTGKGMLIAVMDAGFFKADEQPYLAHLFTNNQIVDTYDFIAGDKQVYDDHKHGLEVLSVMASYLEDHLVGPAYDAEYALYRTEDNDREMPYEEVTWLVAAERADSLGVDIINTSLGYYEFDEADFNYTYAQMDGRTTVISRAAQYAARTGMLVVVSAGNEGSNSWKYITAPADVDSVLTVGGVLTSGQRYPLSSYGPNAEGVIKPDVVALGAGVAVGSTSGTVTSSSGTSFASPLVASFAALLWQAYPEKDAQELADLIRHSGTQAGTPDTVLGYGVPYYGERIALAGPANFKATLNGFLVEFSWEEIPEGGVTIYEIERSFNGGPFEKIASVPGNQYSGDLLQTQGTYRYRIRGIGEYQFGNYSAIQSIDFILTGKETKSDSALIWPNPVGGDKVWVKERAFNVGDPLMVQIYSADGRLVFSGEVSPSRDGVVELSVAAFPSGFFVLKLTTNDGITLVRRFLKSR